MPLLVSATAAWSPLFAGYFTLLTLRVTRLRLSTNITVGDGSDQIAEASQKANPQLKDVVEISSLKRLQRSIRAHANYVENVPFIILMISLLELNGSSKRLIHGLLGGLFVTRVIHSELGIMWNDAAMGHGRPLGMLFSNAILWGATLTNFSLVRNALREHF